MLYIYICLCVNYYVYFIIMVCLVHGVVYLIILKAVGDALIVSY